MANYRGLLWSLVAIAGTATAATLAYRYVTRGTRSYEEEQEEEERRRRQEGQTDATQSRRRTESEASVVSQDEQYEEFSEDEWDEEVDAVQALEQQLVLATREGNMLLSVFGLIFFILVGIVGVIIAWSSEDAATPMDLPMFQPLMWLAIGVFTAASVEVLSQSNVMTAPEEMPVLTDKTVFPHDESDFDMINHYNARKANGASSDEEDGDDSAPPAPVPNNSGRQERHSDDEEEEKAACGVTEDPSSLIARAEELFKDNMHKQTRDLLLPAVASHPTNIELIWRLARACNYLVDESSDPEEKKAFAFEGLGYAEKAYEIDSKSAAANKWKGIMTGTVGNFRDLKDKIAGAYVIRDHIKRAIELDPRDATCHNILGQWCLAFADMTWIEKRAAAALFGTPPTATYDEAVEHFLNAEKISPGFWKKNVFLLAQTYSKMKQDENAREWLMKAQQVPTKTKEDEDVEKDIATLMKKLRM